MSEEVETQNANGTDDAFMDNFLKQIAAGNFDGRFETIEKAMEDRREARKEAVLAQVREVFGDGFEIRELGLPRVDQGRDIDRPMSGTTAQDRLEATNPFFRRKESVNPTELADSDEPIPDVLDTPAMNEVERKMTASSGDTLPIEQRGAIINGLSASDMGDR